MCEKGIFANMKVKGKGEVHPRTGHEGPEGGWSMPHPSHF